MQRLKPQHVSGSAVAASCIGLGLANGGFDATGFSAAALAVWLAVVLLIAIGVAPRAQPPGAAIAAGLCLAGLAGLIALSMLWGSDPGHAFEDVVRALLYVGVFVLVVAASARGDARSWVAGLAAGLAGIAAIALLARFEPSLFGAPDADLARRVPSALGRLTYPVGYWNALAAITATAIVLLAWFGAFAPTRRLRAAAVGAIPAVALALWMTDSRAGIVAAGIAFAVMLLAGSRRSALVASLCVGVGGGAVLIAVAQLYDALLHDPISPTAGPQGDRMLLFTALGVGATGFARHALDGAIARLAIPRRAATVALGAVVLALVALIVVSDPVQRFNDFKQPPTGAEDGLLRGGSSGRYQFWTAAVDAFAGDPVTGVGAAGYTPYWLEHRDLALPATRAHSLLLESMAELGILGLALVLGFFAIAAVVGVRRARGPTPVPDVAPALAVLVVGFVSCAVDWVWDLPAAFATAVLAAALLTGPATLPVLAVAQPAPRGGVARSRRRFAGGVAVLLVAWISICGSVLLLLEDRRIDASRSAADRGDLQGALDAANDAADLEPWAAEPRTQRALIYEQLGDIDDARREIATAIDRSPDDYKLYLTAARLDAEAGDAESERANLAEAVRLNPLDPTVQQLAGTAAARALP